MTKYYIDTEFLEGPQKKWFGQTKPTIDLISIGIVSEDNREYYAISKDFNLKEAWNRYDAKPNTAYPLGGPMDFKVYWIRDNVLKPIWEDLAGKELYLDNPIICKKRKESRGWKSRWKLGTSNVIIVGKNGYNFSSEFSFKSLKYLLKKYGKTNEEIAGNVRSFCSWEERYSPIEGVSVFQKKDENPEFYAYYADYDWVVFCWLFGKMMDLPEGFPKYCQDLKQIMDEEAHKVLKHSQDRVKPVGVVLDVYRKTGMLPYNVNKEYANIDQVLSAIKNHPDYPKQENEHDSLSDARWNKKLHEFLNKYK